MRPFLTHALLVFALLGVVTGSLLKPCDCGEVEAGSSSTPACCCCAADDAFVVHPDDAPVDDGSLKLCRKPRAPFGEPEASVGLDASRHLAFAFAQWTAEVAAPAALDQVTSRAGDAAQRRSCDPWRIAPEGLVLFLI